MLRPVPRVHNKTRPKPVITHVPDENSLLSRLLAPPQPSVPAKYVFYPIVHSENYFRDLESHGIDSTRMRQLHAEKPYVPPPPPPPKRQLNLPKYRDWVPVTLEVTESGKVRCHIRPAMADLYASPCHHKPSIEARLKACRDFGYPPDILLDILDKHEKRLARQPELEEFMNVLFGNTEHKKPAPVKKKTVYQLFKFKKIKYAMPDEDPVIEDRSDTEEEPPVEVDVE